VRLRKSKVLIKHLQVSKRQRPFNPYTFSTLFLTTFAFIMSFGFSIGDIITVATLIRRTANRIRHVPETFLIFTADLAFATQIFHNLERNFGDYDSIIHTLSTADRRPLDISLTGIRDGLRALEERLESYNVGTGLMSGYANYRFSGSLKELRDRLIFHMQCLNLAMSL
jgi:hypothetical protein